MKLFNKYKNKNFMYLTNYINSCISNEELALTPEELEYQLLGTSQSTFKEFIHAVLNQSVFPNHNAGLLYKDDQNKLQPIREVPIPVRASIAEKAWLYYVLQTSNSDLFLNSELKQKLLDALLKDISFKDYPLQQHYIDIREFSTESCLDITPQFITHFQTIVQAVQQHRQLTVTNHSESGKIYSNEIVYPYKIEYSPQFNLFCLSCYPISAKRPVKIILSNLSSVSIGTVIPNYDEFIIDFEKQLSNIKLTHPIQLEILNQREAYDRCTYLFSSYDTYCYEQNNKLTMTIYYYHFQEEEIFRNILFLGHYVKVISPQTVVEKIIQIIRSAYENYPK